MMANPDDIESLLEPEASNELQTQLAVLRSQIVAEAKRIAAGNPISEHDVFLAFSRVVGASPAIVDSQAIIAQAFRENRVAERVSYGMAAVLFTMGLVLLGAGALSTHFPTAAGLLTSGTILEMLIFVPFRFVINARRQNIAIRMLGIILSQVRDPKDLAPLLRASFLKIVLDIDPPDTRDQQ